MIYDEDTALDQAERIVSAAIPGSDSMECRQLICDIARALLQARAVQAEADGNTTEASRLNRCVYEIIA